MSVSIPIQKRLCSLITIKFTWFEKKKNPLQKANTIEQTEFPLGFGRKTLGT